MAASIEQKAIDIVIAHESVHGRDPINVSKNGIRHDLVQFEQEKHDLYIIPGEGIIEEFNLRVSA